MGTPVLAEAWLSFQAAALPLPKSMSFQEQEECRVLGSSLFSLTPQLTLAWVRSRLQEAGVNCGVAAMDLVSIEPWVLLYAGSAAAARGRRVSHELRTEMINAIMVEHGTKVTMTWLTGILRADGYACPAKARQR